MRVVLLFFLLIFELLSFGQVDEKKQTEEQKMYQILFEQEVEIEKRIYEITKQELQITRQNLSIIKLKIFVSLGAISFINISDIGDKDELNFFRKQLNVDKESLLIKEEELKKANEDMLMSKSMLDSAENRLALFLEGKTEISEEYTTRMIQRNEKLKNFEIDTKIRVGEIDNMLSHAREFRELMAQLKKLTGT